MLLALLRMQQRTEMLYLLERVENMQIFAHENLVFFAFPSIKYANATQRTAGSLRSHTQHVMRAHTHTHTRHVHAASCGTSLCTPQTGMCGKEISVPQLACSTAVSSLPCSGLEAKLAEGTGGRVPAPSLLLPTGMPSPTTSCCTKHGALPHRYPKTPGVVDQMPAECGKNLFEQD